MTLTPAEAVELVDYRRAVARLYGDVRESPANETTWEKWRAGRDQIFASHPQSPIPPDGPFIGLRYFDYDPSWRLLGEVEPRRPHQVQITHSAAGSTEFTAVGVATLTRHEETFSVTVYWLSTYGGGVFVPFRDATNGAQTYGGGRYLLDTVKGADLGSVGKHLVFDFNYAYHPSCVHSPRWSCPLSPPENRLAVAVAAGERLAT